MLKGVFLCVVAAVAVAKPPPVLDAEWSAAFLNVWQDFTANRSYSHAGWVHQSFSNLCTRSEQAGGNPPEIFNVVDNYTANVANVMDLTTKTCAVSPTEGDIYESPHILSQLNVTYNRTFSAPVLGDMVTVDEFVLVLPDGGTHRNSRLRFWFKADTNIRVYYEETLEEPEPPTAATRIARAGRMFTNMRRGSPPAPGLNNVKTQLWYFTYENRGNSTTWPDNFFDTKCPF